MAVKRLKQTIFNTKLKDYTFNLNFESYKTFIDNFSEGNSKIGLDLNPSGTVFDK